MSVNPVSAGGLGPDLAAAIAGELTALANDARTLQSRLVTGDIVTATVLPSNGLTDLLDIGGLRVAAQLPPTVLPGETITVTVTGFAGDRINLQILPSSTTVPQESVAQVPAKIVGGSPANTLGENVDNAQDPDSAAPTPARAVTATVSIAHAGGPPAAKFSATAAAGLSPVSAARLARPILTGLGGVEARLATARATTVPSLPPQTAGASSMPMARPVSPSPPHVPLAPAAPASRPTVVPGIPLDALPSRGAGIALHAGQARFPIAGIPPGAPAIAGSARPPIVARPPSPPTIPATPSVLVSPKPADYTEPSALLRALQLPVNPTNIAAARLALTSPEKLPQALDLLERALASSSDPHVTTLKTLVGYLARIEPRSPVLASQVAAFVDHVVVGRESKLVQLLDAHMQTVDDQAATSGASASLHAERVVIRQAALILDFKTQLMAVVTDGREAANAGTMRNPVLLAAAQNVLGAVTALQINAAATLAANPDGLAFVLPMALPSGFAQAHVRINRDGPQAKNAALDGDNFHIGFILETQHVGTVAIDLRTVGRSVTLNIQTEAVLAQLAFSAALAELTGRLESLRYRVVKADAAVAPRGIALPEPEPTSAPMLPPEISGTVDLDA